MVRLRFGVGPFCVTVVLYRPVKHVSYAGARYIMDIADKESAGAARLIARVIISHHGLHDWVDDK